MKCEITNFFKLYGASATALNGIYRLVLMCKQNVCILTQNVASFPTRCTEKRSDAMNTKTIYIYMFGRINMQRMIQKGFEAQRKRV